MSKVQFDRLELDLKSRGEQITRLRASLNCIKTNKEYSAVFTQLNITKADNSKIESQSLELLKNIEADEAECEEIPNQINEQKQHLEQLRTEVETLAGKYQAQIDNIQAEWDQVAQTIPEKPLEIFKRVTESYDGQAVAVIEQQEGKKGAYSCGGCFMGITAECVNLLKTKDDIIRCPNCTRILVDPTENS